MANITTKQTIKIEYTEAQIIPCKARKSFDFAGEHIAEGESFYLIRSSKGNGEYHLVHWVEDRLSWKCSCGAGCKKHSHVEIANQWVGKHIAHKKPAAALTWGDVVKEWEKEPVHIDTARKVKGNLNGSSQGFSLLRGA